MDLVPVAMINGETTPLDQASLPLTDEGVSRGDGAFETIGVWDGVPFLLADHLDRLRASLEGIGLPAPPDGMLAAEAARLLSGLGAVDGALRVYVTASGTRVLTLTPPPSRAPLRRLVSQPAPWIRPRGSYAPSGAKTMSYGPNMAALRAARALGGDDALLLSNEGYVLEGPTFAVLWVAEETLRAPTLSLGVIDSMSRRVVLEEAAALGLRVVEGQWMVGDLQEASEVMACSSVRDLEAVRVVDHLRFDGPTPVRDKLSTRLDERRRRR